MNSFSKILLLLLMSSTLVSCTNHFSECDKASSYDGNCIFRKAAELEHLSACDDLENRKQFICYMGYGVGHEDISACQLAISKFPDPPVDSLVKCFLSSGKSNSACENLLENYKENCYNEAPKYTGNCEDVPQDFLEICYVGLAPIEKSLERCRKISNISIMQMCYSSTAGLTNDPANCELIEDNYSRSGCYYHQASRNKDETLCYNAGGDKDRCFLYVSIMKRDKSVCQKIQDDDERNLCELFFQVKDIGPDVCDQSKGEDCYIMIGGIYGVSECKKIKSKWYSDSCFSNAAIKDKDPEVCNKIKIQDNKEECLTTIKFLESRDITLNGFW